MSKSSNNRFLSSSQGSSPAFSSSNMASSSSVYVPPGKNCNNRFQRPQSNTSSSSRPNRFLKASSFKSSSEDGWKTSNNRPTGNRFTNSNRGYKYSNNRNEPEKKNQITSYEDNFPTLGGSDVGSRVERSATNVALNKSKSMNYSNAIHEDIENHKKNIQPPTRKFVSLVTLKKKKNEEDAEFVEDVEREENYVETTYFTEEEEEEEYYKKEYEERLRRAEEDYDY